VLVGAPTAMGVLEAEYNNDLDCEAGAELAVKAVKAAVARDAVSGDGPAHNKAGGRRGALHEPQKLAVHIL